MHSPSQRPLVLTAILALAAVGIALISQYMFDMQPCAWCVMQRMIYLAIAIVCLIFAFGGRALGRIGSLLALLLALSGAWAAYYQLTVASKLLSCSQTFADKFVSGTGLDGLLPSVFGIFASCADAVVKVLGVEYSVWSMTLFVILALLSLSGLLRRA
jgi:disulfide bond formation protein DsbB